MLAPYTSLATPCPKELNIPTAQCFFPNQTLYSESFAPLQRFQYSGKKYIGLFGNKEIDVIYTAEEGRVWRKREEPEEYKNTTNRKLGSTMETVATVPESKKVSNTGMVQELQYDMVDAPEVVMSKIAEFLNLDELMPTNETRKSANRLPFDNYKIPLWKWLKVPGHMVSEASLVSNNCQGESINSPQCIQGNWTYTVLNSPVGQAAIHLLNHPWSDSTMQLIPLAEFNKRTMLKSKRDNKKTTLNDLAIANAEKWQKDMERLSQDSTTIIEDTLLKVEYYKKFNSFQGHANKLTPLNIAFRDHMLACGDRYVIEMDKELVSRCNSYDSRYPTSEMSCGFFGCRGTLAPNWDLNVDALKRLQAFGKKMNIPTQKLNRDLELHSIYETTLQPQLDKVKSQLSLWAAIVRKCKKDGIVPLLTEISKAEEIITISKAQILEPEVLRESTYGGVAFLDSINEALFVIRNSTLPAK